MFSEESCHCVLDPGWPSLEEPGEPQEHSNNCGHFQNSFSAKIVSVSKWKCVE